MVVAKYEMQNLCQNLRRLREQSGATHVWMARQLHIPESALRRMEVTGELPECLRLADLLALCQALNAQPSRLFYHLHL